MYSPLRPLSRAGILRRSESTPTSTPTLTPTSPTPLEIDGDVSPESSWPARQIQSVSPKAQPKRLDRSSIQSVSSTARAQAQSLTPTARPKRLDSLRPPGSAPALGSLSAPLSAFKSEGHEGLREALAAEGRAQRAKARRWLPKVDASTGAVLPEPRGGRPGPARRSTAPVHHLVEVISSQEEVQTRLEGRPGPDRSRQRRRSTGGGPEEVQRRSREDFQVQVQTEEEDFQPEEVQRRSSAPVQTQKSTRPEGRLASSLSRRHSVDGLPAGSRLQAARMDIGTSQRLDMPAKVQRRLDSQAAAGQPAAAKLGLDPDPGAAWLMNLQRPRTDPGTDARDLPAEAISGLMGPPRTRDARPAKATPKTHHPEDALPGQTLVTAVKTPKTHHPEDAPPWPDPEDAPPRRRAALVKLAQTTPKTHTPEHLGSGERRPDPSPHASASEATRAPSTSPRASASEGAQPDDPEAQAEVPLAATLLEIYSSYKEDASGLPDRFLRLAFNRFAFDGAVPKERLHNALLHLGFLTSTRERSLDLCTELYGFDTLDYTDFCEYAGRFAAIEHSAVRRGADACVAELRSAAAAAPDSVRRFLQSAGVWIPYSRVEEARNAAKLEHKRPDDMSALDLLVTLAACRMREGFTNEEVARAQEVFGKLDQMSQDSPIGWGPLAKVSELAKGLLKYLGLYSVDYINSLADVLPSHSAEQQGVCFHEFLVWARWLHDAMVQDLWERFTELGDGVAGAVSVDKAELIVRMSGISLRQDAVDELLLDLGMQKDDALDFHAMLRFLSAARRTHGFSHSEFEECRAAFEKFDFNRSGELEHIEVLALLRYNGYTTNIEQENVLMRRADCNKNGSMDLDEFSRLMRMMREELIGYARESFDRLSSRTGQLPLGKVKEALAEVHLTPRLAMLAELLHGMPTELSFSQFMNVHDQCRLRVNVEFRKFGGFSDSALEKIARFWVSGCSAKKNYATVGELVWMFLDSRVAPVNTRFGREDFLRRVEAARAAALAAGFPQEEVTRAGTTDIGFHTFLHLIRGMVHTFEQDVLNRENEAMLVSRIPQGEASEFRSAFCDLAARDIVWNQHLSKADFLMAELTMVPAVPESSMPTLLKSIGLRVPKKQLDDLKMFLAQTRSQGEEEDQSIQFATFLRMLGWMFDTDFAGICALMALPKRVIGGCFVAHPP